VAEGLFDLAGPVSKLQFTCYTLDDLDTPSTEVKYLRVVKVATTFLNEAVLGQDKDFVTEAYLRANTVEEITKAIPFEYGPLGGHTPAIAKIDTTHYLCAYTNDDNHGWALVLTVNTSDWTLTKGLALEFDEIWGRTPILERIDATHYLCAYDGPANKGTARMLIVDPSDWTVSRGPGFVYKINHGTFPALAAIDSTHCLCAYASASNDGWAVVLNINTSDWSLTKNDDYEFDSSMGLYPDVAKISANEFLCTYTGPDYDGWATVLEVNMSDWSISQGASLEFDSISGITPAVNKIDDRRFLCAYSGLADDGYAVVLDTGGGTLSAGPKLEYDPAGYTVGHDLANIGTRNFLCVYTGNTSEFSQHGWTTILNASSDDWSVTGGVPFEFDPVHGERPALVKIDNTHYLCVYDGPGDDGWAVVLEAGMLLRP
jgi:regulation of enolase protein 1 (concanavalin A-like superfamily)